MNATTQSQSIRLRRAGKYIAFCACVYSCLAGLIATSHILETMLEMTDVSDVGTYWLKRSDWFRSCRAYCNHCFVRI